MQTLWKNTSDKQESKSQDLEVNLNKNVMSQL